MPKSITITKKGSTNGRSVTITKKPQVKLTPMPYGISGGGVLVKSNKNVTKNKA